VETDITERTPLNILMTGGTTALGRVAIRHLTAAGHSVSAVSGTAAGSESIRKSGGLPVYADENRPGELQGLVKMAKADVVLHFAPTAYFEVPFVNVGWDAGTIINSTRALVDAAKAEGVRFFVHGSSTLAYGDQHGEWVDETARPQPGDNAIVRALLDAERAVINTLPAAVLRFGYLYGAESKGFEEITAMLRRGRLVASGSGIANWVHLDDAAEAVRRVIEAQPAGEIFNIVDETPASSAQFLQDLAQSLGLQSAGSPPTFLRGLYLPGVQRDLIDQISVRGHNTKAAEGFGWTPLYKSHTSGFDQAFLTWRAGEIVRR
jgi:2-alkyl-3-oxoalkanoate reductase